MRSSSVRELSSLFTGPMYVFTKGEAGSLIVDKITTSKEAKISRERYFIAGNQCTCIGFMKIGSCKHLKMLKHEVNSKGVLKEEAIEVLQKFIDLLKDSTPQSVDNWRELCDNVPSDVSQLVLTMHPLESVKDAVLIVGTCVTPSGSIGVIFNFLPSEKKD